VRGVTPRISARRNWLDFLVVITGWMSSVMTVNVSMLRVIKILRPLRSMQRVRGLRVLVQGILSAVPQLGTVTMVLCFSCFVFGVIGVQLFKGATRHQCWDCDGEWTGNGICSGSMEPSGEVCNTECTFVNNTVIRAEDGSVREVIPLFQSSLSDGNGELPCDAPSLGNATRQSGRYGVSVAGDSPAPALLVAHWTCRMGQQCLCGETGSADLSCEIMDNPFYGVNSFDNVFWAFITIFQSITLEGWVDVMYTLQDGTGHFAWAFMIPVVLIDAFIVLNLFLAVICDSFAMADEDPDAPPKEEEEDGDAQAEKAAEELLMTLKNPLRKVCVRIAMNKWFQHTITFCILLNTLIMMARPDPSGGYLAAHDYRAPAVFEFGRISNFVLSGIFGVELIIKLVGLGREFAKDSMNIFDFIIVFISFLEIGMTVGGITFIQAARPLAARPPARHAHRALAGVRAAPFYPHATPPALSRRSLARCALSAPSASSSSRAR